MIPLANLKLQDLFSEFRQLKEENNADFFKMVQTPELACELTLQVQWNMCTNFLLYILLILT